jgi:hypothetical protein
MHIIEVLTPKHNREQCPHHTGLFVGMDILVAPQAESPESKKKYKRIEEKLGQGWSYLDRANEGEPRCAIYSQSRHLYRFADRISN